MSFVEINESIRLQNSFVTVALSFILGQSQCCLASVANLPAIPASFLVLEEMSGSESANLCVLNVDKSVFLREPVFNHGQVVVEDFESFAGIQLWVV